MADGQFFNEHRGSMSGRRLSDPGLAAALVRVDADLEAAWRVLKVHLEATRKLRKAGRPREH